MRFLRQSTAVDLGIGPFLDSGDANTVESALTLTQPDVRLKKNGGAWAQKSAAQTLAHEENGWYEVNLSTTDTDTLGVLLLVVHESGALQVWHEFMVMPANVWDSLFASDLLQVDATQWLGGAIATPTVTGVPEVDQTHQLGSALATPTVAGVQEVDITHIAGVAVSTASAQLGVNLVNIAGSAVNVAAAQLGVNVVNWSGSAVVTPNSAGVPVVDDRTLRTNTATAGAAGSITLDAGAPTTVDLYKGCTISIIGGTGAGQSRLITAYSAGRVASVAPNWVTNPATGSVFDIRAGQTDIEMIGNAAVIASGGRPEVNSVQISGSATAADNLEAGTLGTVSSTCATGSTQTVVNTNLTEATNDHYNGRAIVFTGGALLGQASRITDYNGGTKQLTVDTLTEAPANTDPFVIV